MPQKKYFIIGAAAVGLVLILLLTAYFNSGFFYRTVINYKGEIVRCIDGVRYIVFNTGASVKYDKNTRQIELCD